MIQRHDIIGFAISIVVCVWLVPGCGFIPPPPAKETGEAEPNDNFDQAQQIDLKGGGAEQISGILSGPDDYDVFELGNISENQMISLSIKSDYCSGEFVSAGLFDSEGGMAKLSGALACNEGQVRILSHRVVKSDRYYVAVVLADQDFQDSLSYQLHIEITPAIGTFHPRGQIVFLDFDGAEHVWVGSRYWPELLPMSSVFGPARARNIAADVLQLVRDDYEGLDIDILSSYQEMMPMGPTTVVYVTGTDDPLYGLADSTDWYNRDADDRAVVFVSGFDRHGWSDGQIATATANVVSHELGHLLGLVHTDDHTELMDATTPSNLLRLDQDFHEAMLSDFPIGYQDAMELLMLTLGIEE